MNPRFTLSFCKFICELRSSEPGMKRTCADGAAGRAQRGRGRSPSGGRHGAGAEPPGPRRPRQGGQQPTEERAPEGAPKTGRGRSEGPRAGRRKEPGPGKGDAGRGARDARSGGEPRRRRAPPDRRGGAKPHPRGRGSDRPALLARRASGMPATRRRRGDGRETPSPRLRGLGVSPGAGGAPRRSEARARLGAKRAPSPTAYCGAQLTLI